MAAMQQPAMQQPMWRPWTDPAAAVPAPCPSSAAAVKTQGLRNITNGDGSRQPRAAKAAKAKAAAAEPPAAAASTCSYGPSPRVLREQGAEQSEFMSISADGADADAATPVARAEAPSEPHPWDERVRQLQERFDHQTPKKAIVEALEHTNGHAGKAARLLRSQWSPSALQARPLRSTASSTTEDEEVEVTPAVREQPHEAPAEAAAEEVAGQADIEEEHQSGQGEAGAEVDVAEADDIYNSAGQTARTLAAASSSLRTAVAVWADTTDTTLHPAAPPAGESPVSEFEHRQDVAVRCASEGRSSVALVPQEEVERRAAWEAQWMEELHQHAHQMVAEQERFEVELGDLQARSAEEREEMRTQHEEEIEAWQLKAAALQAEVVALQKARRAQRKQHREMSGFLQVATATADAASAELRKRRQQHPSILRESSYASSGYNDSHCLSGTDIAVSEPEGQEAREHEQDGAAEEQAQLQQQDVAAVVAGAAAEPYQAEQEENAVSATSSDEEELQVEGGYSTCVEPPEHQQLGGRAVGGLSPIAPSPTTSVLTPDFRPRGAAPGPSPVMQQRAATPAPPRPAAPQATPASAVSDRRRRRQFLAATEGMPGITGGSVMRGPKERHASRLQHMETAGPTMVRSSSSSGGSTLQATSSRSERGRARQARAAAEVQARRMRQPSQPSQQPHQEPQLPPRRTRSGPAASQTDLQRMAELYEAGNQPLLALAYKRSACAVQGAVDVAVDQRRVGLEFLRGEVVARNKGLAAYFLREAANLGDAAAQCWLATCYAEGWGVSANQVEAADLYAKSARRGYARAQNNLAVCYADGRGRVQDCAEAVRWWKTAASLGDATALTWLGVVHATGWGSVPIDERAAKGYFLEAASKGDVDAQVWLEDLQARGTGVGGGSRSERKSENPELSVVEIV